MDKRIERMLLGCALAVSLGCAPVSAHAHEGGCDITYTGEQSEFITAGSELFSSVENGLPGDTFSGRLTMTNESESPCEFFIAVKDVVAKGPDDALDRIALAITEAKDAVVFDGALSAADGAEPIGSGVVQPGESVQAVYDIVIPPELTSEYADTEVGMNVAVSVVEHSDDAGATVEEQSQGASLAKTGDSMLWLPLAFAVTGAATIGGCAVMVRRRGWRWR